MAARFRRAIHGTTLIGLLIGPACGERRGTEVVQQRDSAGIRIVETPGVTSRAQIGWTVAKLPDLQLGSAVDDGPELFDGIGQSFRGGIAGLPDGRIVVVNGASGELRFFDNEGRFLNRAGGLGNGPGEFRSPLLVPYASSDSLLIFDQRGSRYTLVSNDGRAYRNFRLDGVSTELVVGWPRGVSDFGILTTPALIDMTWNDGQHLLPIRVRWVTRESRSEKIVGEYHIPYYVTNNLPGGPYGLDVPFNVRPAVAVGRHGFFVTHGNAPEVHEFDNGGRLTRIFRLIEPGRPVTPEEVEAAIESRISSFTIPHSEVRAVYRKMDFPDRWPTFQSARIDRLGWLWVELYQPTRTKPARWMVFDSSGVAVGTVELPADLQVHDIGSDYVLGRWVDSLRVEYVRRYRLDRSR